MHWDWFVWGKHPGIPDFICVGTQTPLFQRFTKWVDTGFSRIEPMLKIKYRHCSWRFWTRGASDEVVCGLVRNSCDSYGRSFPLIFLGTGHLQNWRRNRSLLPFAFEAVWKRFEYVAAARCETVAALNEAMQLIEPPEPLWRPYQQRIHNASDLYAQARNKLQVHGSIRLFIVDCKVPENLPRNLSFCNNVVASGDSHGPTVVFIGEICDSIAVAIVDDLLLPANFAWLWSQHEEVAGTLPTR
jgi:type VI secretion system ImpM family protein